MKRRNFLKFSFFTSSILLSNKIEAKDIKNNTKIVILGGGFGGLSAAKYLKELNPLLDITLIEKKQNFTSCPFSNAWLGDIEGITLESLKFNYNDAINKYAYKFINDTIIKIKREKKEIICKKHIIKYDYLIISLGIDYNYKKLFKNNLKKIIQAKSQAPAGLKDMEEILKLKKMIKNFTGGNFVISLPKSMFKCPSAPYERACMIANYFKQKNIKGKVIIIDPRAKPASEAKSYQEAFNTIYKDLIEYKNKHKFKDIDFDKKTIKYQYFDEKELEYVQKNLKYEELCLIPPNMANKLYKKSKIKTYANGFVKLKRPSYQSIDDEKIFIIGDAQGEYLFAKSAQMANSCALIVAKHINSQIEKDSFDYKKNLPGNICYSIIAPNKAAWITHNYKYIGNNLKRYVQSSENSNKANFIGAKAWYKGLTNDLFGL